VNFGIAMTKYLVRSEFGRDPSARQARRAWGHVARWKFEDHFDRSCRDGVVISERVLLHRVPGVPGLVVANDMGEELFRLRSREIENLRQGVNADYQPIQDQDGLAPLMHVPPDVDGPEDDVAQGEGDPGPPQVAWDEERPPYIVPPVVWVGRGRGLGMDNISFIRDSLVRPGSVSREKEEERIYPETYLPVGIDGKAK
jgi:hypothetical protein